MRKTKILAIDPGSKEMGVAVLEGEELLYYGVKTLRKRHTLKELSRQVEWITRRLISDYDPEILAIEKTFAHNHVATSTGDLAGRIKTLARRSGLAIYEYAPLLVRKRLCQTVIPSKRETAQRVVREFPELRGYLNRKSKWETLYYSKVFGAVAVGLVCRKSILEAGGEDWGKDNGPEIRKS